MKGTLKEFSKVNYNYATIKITPSRLNKGLLAVPRQLSGSFPQQSQELQVYLNDSPESQVKPYSSYNSSTRECRINGLKDWFGQNAIRSGDEIVIQFIDRERFIYRLIPENRFLSETRNLQQALDNAKTEVDASKTLGSLSKWTLSDNKIVSLNEYGRLASTSIMEARRYGGQRIAHSRENVPPSLRTLLSRIYLGHCQLCDFWFLKRDNNPYFEVHHLDPAKGHHPKNVVVVCGNCHNQFEYSAVHEHFNDDQWLVEVSFNRKVIPVKQAMLQVKLVTFTKEVFV